MTLLLARRTAAVLALLLAVAPLDAAVAAGAWTWPLDGPRRVVEAFRAPAHAYGAGHRGIDLPAPAGTGVRSPAAGVVAFRGTVVDRPLITIDHGDGLVSTIEPVDSTLAVGDAVATGDPIGVVAAGGHAVPGTVHLGVRKDGVYINPLLLLGGIPRAVLLPMPP